MNARTNLIGLDDATGGWSFKSLGLTLGSFVGVPFIIPHASISRTTYAETARVERSKETIVGKPEKLDWNTLFEVPKVNSDGTYTLKLKKHSPLSFNEIEVSLPNGAKFENGEIVGLKDFGVKVLREPTGKYNVSYSTVPVLKVGAMPDRGIDVTLDRVESIKDALNIQKIRVQLSTLLTSWSPLKPKMNDWANAMDAFERTST